MRYYRIEIKNKNGATPLADDGTPIGPFDSSDSPGSALHIEFDTMIIGLDVATSGTVLSIYGIPLSMLKQSVSLKDCNVMLYAGFTDGLPLANPLQRGLIFSGQIYSAYANWQGTHQSLNLVVNPSIHANQSGRSITISGKKGDKLSDVLLMGLKNSFPDFKLKVEISDNLVLNEDLNGVYTTLSQLAFVVKSWSKASLFVDLYTGVHIVIEGKTVRIFDGSSTGSSGGIHVLAHELIGQPTWVEFGTMSFKCPLRSDIHVGDTVTLPEDVTSGPLSLLAVENSRSLPSIRNKSNFSGEFLITSVRHTGSFLNADSNNAWVTNYQAVAKSNLIRTHVGN